MAFDEDGYELDVPNPEGWPIFQGGGVERNVHNLLVRLGYFSNGDPETGVIQLMIVPPPAICRLLRIWPTHEYMGDNPAWVAREPTTEELLQCKLALKEVE